MSIYTDDNGEWTVYDNGVKALTKPSEKWLAEHPEPKPEPEPTPDDIAVRKE